MQLKVDNFSDAKESLRIWREKNERRSEDVLFLWKAFIEYNISKLGKEKHLILEQVCLAALDRHEFHIVRICINLLLQDFPKSLRVQKYIAMKLEAQERYEEALQILDAIIKEDETNSAPRKRKVAILKAQGKTVDAIKELTEYLKIFMADVEAWQELSELYISEQDFAKAAFCVEELLLHNPHNHLLHQRYAEIRYSQGGYDNIELARSYYCQALKLNSKNLRALYGLYLTSSQLATSQKSTAQKKKEAQKIADSAYNSLQEYYSSAKTNIDSIEDRLSALQIS